MELNETEKKLLKMFLEDLADRMGNSSCNDFTLPNTPENAALLLEVAETNPDLNEEERQEELRHLKRDIKNDASLCTFDFGLVHFLIRKLKL
jgi:hypothetical protein